jgi:hypothetical protein
MAVATAAGHLIRMAQAPHVKGYKRLCIVFMSALQDHDALRSLTREHGASVPLSMFSLATTVNIICLLIVVTSSLTHLLGPIHDKSLNPDFQVDYR